MFKSFPTYRQLDSMDCGPTCLRMIAKYYGRSYTVQYLRERAFITRRCRLIKRLLKYANTFVHLSFCGISGISLKNRKMQEEFQSFLFCICPPVNRQGFNHLL